MKKRIVLVSSFIILLTLTLANVSWPESLKEVRFGSFSVAVDYGPYLVAKNRGWFDAVLKKRGIATTYTLFQSLPPINEAFATGRVDVVFEAEPPAIVGKAAGIDIKIVGISCSLVQEVLVPSNSAVQSIKDLGGKKIAVLAGTSSHYGLLKILKEGGVEPSSVQVIDMIPPDAKNAFQTGKVDGWAVWPPWVEQEELAGTGRVLQGGNAVIHSIMAARGEFARKHPDVLRELVAELQRAKEWMQQNPDQAQDIVAKELDVPLEVVKRAWPRHDWAAQITKDVTVDIQAKADFLTANQFIRKPVKVSDDLIDLSLQGT